MAGGLQDRGRDGPRSDKVGHPVGWNGVREHTLRQGDVRGHRQDPAEDVGGRRGIIRMVEAQEPSGEQIRPDLGSQVELPLPCGQEHGRELSLHRDGGYRHKEARSE